MTSTEGGQPGVLDLVDDRRNPDLEEPVVERAWARPVDVVDDRKARRAAQRFDDGGRHLAARKHELERTVDVDYERRSQAFDERISACVSGSEPACSPGEERFVRFSITRDSCSIPGG